MDVNIFFLALDPRPHLEVREWEWGKCVLSLQRDTDKHRVKGKKKQKAIAIRWLFCFFCHSIYETLSHFSHFSNLPLLIVHIYAADTTIALPCDGVRLTLWAASFTNNTHTHAHPHLPSLLYLLSYPRWLYSFPPSGHSFYVNTTSIDGAALSLHTFTHPSLHG